MLSLRPLAQLRRERADLVAHLKSLKSKLSALVASADEHALAGRNSFVGNAAFDVKVLTPEINECAETLWQITRDINDAEEAAHQRQAERDHGPTMAILRHIVSETPHMIGAQIISIGRMERG